MARNRWMLTNQPLLLAVAAESHEFAKMEHRRNDLLYAARYLFANSGFDWPAMEAARKRLVPILTRVVFCAKAVLTRSVLEFSENVSAESAASLFG